MNPQTPDNEVAAPRYELEKGVCKSKVDSLLCDPDRKVTGYFLTKENGDICMVDKGAVRWITKEEWWWLFHESNEYPKEGQLSDKYHNEVARLRELLKNVIDVLRTQAPLHYTIARMAYEKINPESRLAPAPEEPISIPTDLNQQNKENTLSLNEWR